MATLKKQQNIMLGNHFEILLPSLQKMSKFGNATKLDTVHINGVYFQVNSYCVYIILYLLLTEYLLNKLHSLKSYKTIKIAGLIEKAKVTLTWNCKFICSQSHLKIERLQFKYQ